MDVADFLDQCLLVDLEARGDAIARIGAVFAGESFERRGRFDLKRALAELDGFAARSRVVLGHNLVDHDLPLLARQRPDLGLLAKPVVDTLFLSPLAFPENPYHRLVKDYKLVRESLNDPVADARLAGCLFRDQWASFAACMRRGETEAVSFYRYCCDTSEEHQSALDRGLAAVFDGLGAAPTTPAAAMATLRRLLDGRVCSMALADMTQGSDPAGGERRARAYAVAWLQVAGANSVLPVWVRRRFPQVVHLLRRLRDVPCNDGNCAYCRSTHDPHVQLQRYFAFAQFRPQPVSAGSGTGLQETIVRAAMGGQALLAVLPTGGGKSLCYQLPALVRHFRLGLLTVVISPLQALMKDQVDNLTARTGSLSAAALSGMLTPPERGEVLERVRLGDVAILYVAPEQLRNRSFRKAVGQREIGGWVFDEAHCLSKWGHDFRPDYLYAGRFIREFSREQGAVPAPVSCFTATAKPDVKQEILHFFQQELGQELLVFEGGVERENLSFQVEMVHGAEKLARIHAVLRERLPDAVGSALVYTATRAGAEETARYLELQGWAAAAFHAGLTAPEKRAVQEAFLRGEVSVICATNAFGMGIDKDDIRVVLHADIPGALENYLQEAGRAGRDLRDAQCVLLYNEQDVENQFRLGALSEVSQRDIAQILRGLRRARRSKAGEVVITSGELLRDEAVETSFDSGDVQADAKVKAAVAWLERAGFVERNDNNTRVFQGKPLVRSLDEARARIARLNLPEVQQQRWLAVLQALMNAEADEGLSADLLAELPAFRDNGRRRAQSAGPVAGDSHEVMRTLHSMAEAGLIRQGLLLTAFVRHKVKSHSELIFTRACALEEAMLRLMREAAPDAAAAGWLDLSLRKLNQRLVDDGYTDSSPHVLLGLLKSLSMDGRGLAGNRGSLDIRQAYQDHYRVKLQRDWETLAATARKRRAVAGVALATILSRVPRDAPVSAEVLVDFTAEDIGRALRSNIYLADSIRDPLAAIDRGLMYLHEQKAIILQQGLAVFRQAMTIRIARRRQRRHYGRDDYEPLQQHYREKAFQVHVMNEYARLGLDKIRRALELVLGYFSMERNAFIKRFFPGRKEALERRTGEASYRRIVTSLRSRPQMAVVTAPVEANLLILAGPGSGKTRVVVHRCGYLLRVKRVPARSILVLCFNRNAASALRRRLVELVGSDARGVMVQTYHGLAMRLTGTSFADLAQRGRGEPPRFDRLIPEAVRVLRGEHEVLGVDADEVRDRLLGGYSHILVDEYQDIDQEQYDLISALAGRTEQEQDRKLAILAVGDDDQNIYSFRGTNVKFIRQFREDYGARVHYLVENYRSTRPIIAAANQLIAANRDRMKTGRAIRIDRERERRGGAGGGREAAVEGRVQLLEVADRDAQALALAAELQALRRARADLRWEECAVLARTREMLDPIRALFEDRGIPFVRALERDKTPSLARIREIARFLELLKARRQELFRASDLERLLAEHGAAAGVNPWHELLAALLASWSEETVDAELAAAQAIEYIHEALAEQRRDQTIGHGVFLGTVHGAKGMEFAHVFLLDGGWLPARSAARAEEERRLFYVGMTRAREGLWLFARRDAPHGHLELVDGDFLLRRPGPPPGAAAGEAGERFGELMSARYELLGMQDMFLSYAANWPVTMPIHRHLAALEPGSMLTARAARGRIELQNAEGHGVALLSASAARVWLPRLGAVRSIRVVGMIGRDKMDAEEGHRQACRCERWEVPWVEVVSR
jgi:ATP-dependent DNA helicase RecQ